MILDMQVSCSISGGLIFVIAYALSSLTHNFKLQEYFSHYILNTTIPMSLSCCCYGEEASQSLETKRCNKVADFIQI